MNIQERNLELNNWFIDRVHKGMHKDSDAFDKAYNLRGEIIEMELPITQENLLLHALKEKVIKEMMVEAEQLLFNELLNKLGK